MTGDAGAAICSHWLAPLLSSPWASLWAGEETPDCCEQPPALSTHRGQGLVAAVTLAEHMEQDVIPAVRDSVSPRPMVPIPAPTHNLLFVAGCLRQVWCQQDKGK